MIRNLNIKIDWLFLFIVLLPTFYMNVDDLRHAQMNFFQISIIVLVALFHVNRYMGVFMGWCVFQFLFFKDSPNSNIVLQNICFGLILYHFIVKYTNPSKKYLFAIYSVLILSVFWIPLQIYNIDPVWSSANPQFQNTMTEYPGFFCLPAIFGNYAAAAMPFAFVLNPLLAGFALIALFFSKSSFSILAAMGGLLFFFWFRKRIVFWILLVLLGASSVAYILKVDMPEGQFGRRFGAWSLIVKKAVRSQFFGYGIGSYGSKYRFVEASPSLHNAQVTSNAELISFLVNEAMAAGKIDLAKDLISQDLNNLTTVEISSLLQKNGMDMHEWDPAHNEFLQIFFETGLVGLVIVIGYIYDIFKRFFASGLQKDFFVLSLAASFFSIVIISFAHFPFHLARTGGIFLVIMALFETCLLRFEE